MAKNDLFMAAHLARGAQSSVSNRQVNLPLPLDVIECWQRLGWRQILRQTNQSQPDDDEDQADNYEMTDELLQQRRRARDCAI